MPVAHGILFSFRPKCTGYYPTPDGHSTPENRMEGGPLDRRGRPLCTLEEHVIGNVPYISVAMDRDVFPYGTILCIPAFNRKYGKQLVFKVVDTGGAFQDKRFKKLDICCDTRASTLSTFLNQDHDVVALVHPMEP